MKQYDANNILNIALAGHSGAGKTSLTEAMLYLAKATDRRGKVADGNTVSDYDPEEISRKTSVSTAVAPLEWNGKKVNLLDAPGLFDFEGGVCEAARAADSMIIVLSGKDGVLVGTEKADTAANKRKLAKVFFVNGMTEEASHFYDVLAQIRELEKGAISRTELFEKRFDATMPVILEKLIRARSQNTDWGRERVIALEQEIKALMQE